MRGGLAGPSRAPEAQRRAIKPLGSAAWEVITGLNGDPWGGKEFPGNSEELLVLWGGKYWVCCSYGVSVVTSINLPSNFHYTPCFHWMLPAAAGIFQATVPIKRQILPGDFDHKVVVSFGAWRESTFPALKTIRIHFSPSRGNSNMAALSIGTSGLKETFGEEPWL